MSQVTPRGERVSGRKPHGDKPGDLKRSVRTLQKDQREQVENGTRSEWEARSSHPCYPFY